MASAGIAANQAREEHILLLIAKKQQEIRHLREELKALAVQKAKMKKAEAKAEADRAAVGGAKPSGGEAQGRGGGGGKGGGCEA